MEQARKLPWEDAADDQVGSRPGPDRPKAGLDGLEKLLHFGRAAAARSQDVRDRDELSRRNLPAALDLVHQAAEAIRVTEDRAQEMETRAKTLAQRATEELKAAETRLQAAEARARAAETRAENAEARAQKAEARAQEAEEWLARIHDAIMEQLALDRTQDPADRSSSAFV